MSLMKQLKEKTGYYYGVNDKSGKYELEFALKLLGVRVGRIRKIFSTLEAELWALNLSQLDDYIKSMLKKAEKGVLAELTDDVV